MIIKITALQYPLGQKITLEDKLFLIRRRPDFVCLPEYYFVNPDCGNAAEAARDTEANTAWLEKLSVDLSTTVIGGSMIAENTTGYVNRSLVYSRGRFVGSYDKVNLYGNEPLRGIVPGEHIKSFEIDGVRIGVLICADALQPQSFHVLKKRQVDVIFVPTTSPHRPHDTVFEKRLRDNRIFVRGAQLANAYVVKTGGVGTLFGHSLQGRSAVFAPWGILAKTTVEDESRKRIITVLLDLDEIREFKEKMVFTTDTPVGEP